jgi:hypothetical protein
MLDLYAKSFMSSQKRKRTRKYIYFLRRAAEKKLDMPSTQGKKHLRWRLFMQILSAHTGFSRQSKISGGFFKPPRCFYFPGQAIRLIPTTIFWPNLLA